MICDLFLPSTLTSLYTGWVWDRSASPAGEMEVLPELQALTTVGSGSRSPFSYVFLAGSTSPFYLKVQSQPPSRKSRITGWLASFAFGFSALLHAGELSYSPTPRRGDAVIVIAELLGCPQSPALHPYMGSSTQGQVQFSWLACHSPLSLFDWSPDLGFY